LCAALAAAVPAFAEAPRDDYRATPGQPGKDVVWIPSPEATVEKMLDLAGVTPRDYVVDLGSGDGRNVIAAARRGARALGVEYNPELVALSKRAAAAAGVSDRAAFVEGDMFEADVSKATVLILFLIPDNLRKLMPRFLGLRPGTRIVTNTYELGGGWEPDERAATEPCLSWCIAYLYVVPARVAGTWRLGGGESLTLEQNFQSVYGTFEIDGVAAPVEGLLRGHEISFVVNEVAYTGRVNGDTMEGVAKGRVAQSWRATLAQ
jgi:SAM-dependent methyltransferase